MSLWQVLSDPLQYNLNINSGTAKKLADFRALIGEFIEQNETLNAYELAHLVVQKSGIYREAYDDKTPEGMSRAENIEELLNAMNEFVSTRTEEGAEDIRLIDFLSEVSLLTDQDTDQEAEDEKVTLMTVHSAKGLEFNHVFVVGLEEDLFPSRMAMNEMRGLEEARRLFYVAITRAKKTCTLTFAKSRFKNGQINPARESRFLRDIDPEYLSMERNTLSTQRETPNDGFWGSLRNQQVFRKEPEQPSFINEPKKISPVARSASSPPLSKEAEALHEGNVIEHERFGRGVVSAIEQSGNDKRAFVDFESAGTKQLLLKFAKFKIIS